MGPSVHPRHLRNLSHGVKQKTTGLLLSFVPKAAVIPLLLGEIFLAGVIFSNDEVGIGNGDPWFTPSSHRC